MVACQAVRQVQQWRFGGIQHCGWQLQPELHDSGARKGGLQRRNIQLPLESDVSASCYSRIVQLVKRSIEQLPVMVSCVSAEYFERLYQLSRHSLPTRWRLLADALAGRNGKLKLNS